MGKSVEPLLSALSRSGIGGFPVEAWIATATAMARDGVRYGAADVRALCDARPDQVSVHRTKDGLRYSPGVGAGGEIGRLAMSVPSIAAAIEKNFGPFIVEDDIAAALITLWDTPSSDPGVREYLKRVLPDQCADGTGRGIEALRARAGEPDVDLLLAGALDRRANRVPSDAVRLRREAVELYTAAGQRTKAAEVRGVLSNNLATAGDLVAAVAELELAGEEYRRAAASDPYHLRFVAVVELNLGRLHSRAGRRRAARAATRNSLRLFQAIAAQDHRFADEVRLARRQLAKLRWWGSVS